MTPHQFPRRTVVGAAIWTAPTVLVVSAAPAMAASTAPALTFDFGSSSYVPVVISGAGTFYDLNLVGATVTTATAIAPGTLSALVQYRPDVPYPPNAPQGTNGQYRNGTPAGWTATPAGTGATNSVTWVYGGGIAAGGSVTIPTGNYVGTNYRTDQPQGEGFVDVTLTAPGVTSATASLATPRQGAVARSGGAARLAPGLVGVDPSVAGRDAPAGGE